MEPLAISGILFGCIVGGALLGMILRAVLPEEHLSADTKDVVKLGMGLIGTMTALVLGLLVASAKSGYDVQRNGVAQLAGNVMFLDRTLAHYGPEAKEVRDMLRAAVADLIARTWPEQSPRSDQPETRGGTEGRYEYILEKIHELAPKNERQRALQAQALGMANDIGKARWLLFAQQGSSVPTPFLVVVGFWLTVLFASFTLFAPRNGMVFFTLCVSALAVASALFLILELDQPFRGLMQVPSAPLRNALDQLGR
jgi:Protein of unknown function (DUF4239)